jgi:hypothetical protein
VARQPDLALQATVVWGMVDTAVELIAAGVGDVNQAADCRTLLSWAYEPAIVAALLEAGAAVNVPGHVSVLRAACEKLMPESVQLLLAAGADTGTVWAERLVLSLMGQRCDAEHVGDKIAVMRLLLDAGLAAPTVREIEVERCNAGTGDRDVQPEMLLRALVERDPDMVARESSDDGLLPLWSAAQVKNPGMVRVLLEAGADVGGLAADARRSPPDSVPILFAIFSKHSISTATAIQRRMRQTLGLLLDAGAQPTVLAASGRTVLMEALSGDQRVSDSAVGILIGDMIEHILVNGK